MMRILQRTRVLVLAYPDGYLEVFSDQGVDIHVVTPIYMRTPAGEALADEYVDATLPKRFAGLHVAPMLRTIHQAKVIRPSDVAKRLLRLDLIREARAIGAEPEEACTWTF